jgi:Mg2+ and Co2+ transporter CorA
MYKMNNDVKNDSKNGQLSGLELERIRLDEERNKIERNKYRLGIISVIVTISLGFGAFLYQSKIQQEQSKADFEIKSMEIILNSRKPEEMWSRAKLMVDLFPSRLSKDLPNKIAQLYNLPTVGK